VKLSLNPNADLSTGEFSKLVAKQKAMVPDEHRVHSNDARHLKPCKRLTIMDRRRLRREEGYYAAEQRFREVSICVIGSQGILGDVEATLNLKTYTATAVCIQELSLYEMDASDFTQLILHKNVETYENMRESVREKLEFRKDSNNGEIPIYNALLTLFKQAQPKDRRKQILKSYHEKPPSQQCARRDLLSQIAKARLQVKNNTHNVKDENLPPNNMTEKESKSGKHLLSMWRKTARHVIIKKKEQNEIRAPKQYSVGEYKSLKKKMQALGKSTLKGGWS